MQFRRYVSGIKMVLAAGLSVFSGFISDNKAEI